MSVIFFIRFEIPKSNLDDPETQIVPIYLREKKYSMKNNEQNSVSTQPLFGFPFLLAVPRKNCTYDTLYELLLKRMA